MLRSSTASAWSRHTGFGTLQASLFLLTSVDAAAPVVALALVPANTVSASATGSSYGLVESLFEVILIRYS